MNTTLILPTFQKHFDYVPTTISINETFIKTHGLLTYMKEI
jgi:hypothetical protein